MNNNFAPALRVAVSIMQGSDNPFRTREFACDVAAGRYGLRVKDLLDVIPSGQMLRNIRTDFSTL